MRPRTYFNQFIISSTDKVSPTARDVEGVNRARGAIQVTYSAGIQGLIVANLAVRASGDDLMLQRVVAHVLE